MARIEYINDRTGSLQEARGSDSRLNVSARADARAYYNSRDEEECYSVPWEQTDTTDGEYVVYMTNTSTTKTMVVSSIGVNATQASRLKLWFVTGTGTGGNAVTPTNLNKHSSNDAAATVLEGETGGVGGLSTAGLIDSLNVGANGHEEFRLTDRVRLGQGDAIAVEMDDNATSSLVHGVVFMFFEED